MIDKKQDIIDRKGTIIDGKNDSIINLSNVNNILILRDARLQEEYVKQATASKSFPLLIAEVDIYDPLFQGNYDETLKLIFSLKNVGKYTIKNIRIGIEQVQRYTENKDEFPAITLGPGELRTIKTEPFAQLIQTDYQLSYRFMVRWESYNYYFEIKLPFKVDNDASADLPDNSSLDSQYINSIERIYKFQGKEFTNLEKFKMHVLKNIN